MKSKNAKAIVVGGAYIGQGWYVDIVGEPRYRCGNGVTRKIAVRAAAAINSGRADNVIDAIHLAEPKTKKEKSNDRTKTDLDLS